MEKEGFSKEISFEEVETPLKDSYIVNFEIGRGTYSKVYEVKLKNDEEGNGKNSKIRACKYIAIQNFKKEDLKRFEKEIEFLKNLDHPNIVKLYQLFKTPKSYYLIMEKCEGGNLYNKIQQRINTKTLYNEKILSELIREIASAISFCHEKGICHRDLKPENICFTKLGNMENNSIKIIDFGLGKYINRVEKLDTPVGTLLYMAPEVLKNSYNEKCDIWSIGVILYFLVEGRPPFAGENEDDGIIKMKIKSMKYKFSKVWENYSKKGEEIKHLVKHMLIDEKHRYTAKEVLEHPWIKKFEKSFPNDSKENLNQIKVYQKLNEFGKKIILFIASRLNSSDEEKLKNFFVALDKDNDGKINYNEFELGIKGVSSEDLRKSAIQKLFNNIDTNKDGSLQYTEIVASCINEGYYLSRNNLREVFDAIDKKRKGKISKEDIISVLKLDNTEPLNFEIYYSQMEKDEEGKIDFGEFIKMITIIIAEAVKK